MILDDFKLVNTIFQIQYPEAYEIWDRAGSISRQLTEIWPDLKNREAKPQQQSLSNREVHIQTGFVQTTFTLFGEKGLDELKVSRIKESYEVLRSELNLSYLERVSTRVVYAKEFRSAKEANAFILGKNLGHWPETKVFDQPLDGESNGLELHYRFEDSQSFAVLRLKAESLKFEADLDPYYVDEPDIRVTKHRVNIDFDRGTFGSDAPEKLRIDEWFKGYMHILRRDIEKVLKGRP